MKISRGFKGIWFPEELWIYPGLNWIEKLLLLEIDSLNKKGAPCYASNKYLAAFFGVSENHITHRISKLKKQGFVFTKNEGGRRRLIQSNLTGWVAQKCDPGSHNPATQGENTIIDESTRIDHCPETQGQTVSDSKTLHPRYLKFAKILAEGIAKHKKINHNANRSIWAKAFKLLHKKNEVAPNRIKVVLEWYVEHMMEEYVPVAHSGSAFREKFTRIEDAMKRCTDSEPEEPEEIVLLPNEEKSAKVMMDSLAHCSTHIAAVVRPQVRAFIKGMYAWSKNILPKLEARESASSAHSKDRHTAERLKRDLYPFYLFIDDYCCWIYTQIEGWDGWAGSLAQFYPGKKQFCRFLNLRLGRSDLTWPVKILGEMKG